MRAWVSTSLVAATLAALAGCGPAKTVTHERLTSPRQIFALVHQRNASVRTLEGDGLLTVETPEGSNNGSFDVCLKKPDSLRLEFFGPFGIRAGTLLLSRTQFVYYNKMDNTAMVGRPDGTTLRSMFRLKLRFDEVLDAFTGEFPGLGDSDSTMSLSMEDNEYVLRCRNADGGREYKIDGDSFVVTGYRVFDTEGQEILTASSSRIRTNDNIPVPKLLRVIFPRERRSVTIAYDDVTLNRPVGCAFSLPEQAEVIDRE